MQTSLRSRTISALSWSLIQEFAQRSFQFGIGVVLARLLEPAAFGLLAMVTVVTGIAQALLESGFAEALIQRRRTTDVEESSVFYFNILVGVFFASSLWVAAPGIAAFFDQPALTSLTRVLACVPVLNSLTVVHGALMVRCLNFKRQAGIAAGSLAFSGVIGLLLAVNGFGVWSLVAQQVSGSAARACLCWTLNAWRPRRVFSGRALGEMFRFGSGMLGSNLLNTFFQNLYPAVIGKLFSAADLGYYSRAQTLHDISSQSLSTIASRVTFPMFASLQHERSRLRAGLRKAMTTLAFVQFPLMIGLAAVAEPLILLLLTDKWAPSIRYLQLLCLAGLFYPLHFLNLNILMALGRSELFLRLGLIKLLIVGAIVMVTYRWGMLAMIVGQVVFSVLAHFINSFYTARLVNYSSVAQLRDVSPYLGAAVVIGVLVTFGDSLFPANPLWHIGLKLSLGGVGYVALCRAMRLQAIQDVALMVRGAVAAT